MKRTLEDMEVILNELKDQCLQTANFIQKLDLSNKSQDEKDLIAGELSANLAILTVNSGLIESYLDDEVYGSFQNLEHLTRPKYLQESDEAIPSFLK